MLNIEEDINQQVIDFAIANAQASTFLSPGVNVEDACIYAQVDTSNHVRWYVEVELRVKGLKSLTYILYRVWRDGEYQLHAIAIGQA